MNAAVRGSGPSVTFAPQRPQDARTAVAGDALRLQGVDQNAAAIASAVEQQGAATQAIARNVSQAANGTAEVSSNIAGVSAAAQQAGSAATAALSSASELSKNSDALKAYVENFLREVRAA